MVFHLFRLAVHFVGVINDSRVFGCDEKFVAMQDLTSSMNMGSVYSVLYC